MYGADAGCDTSSGTCSVLGRGETVLKRGCFRQGLRRRQRPPPCCCCRPRFGLPLGLWGLQADNREVKPRKCRAVWLHAGSNQAADALYAWPDSAARFLRHAPLLVGDCPSSNRSRYAPEHESAACGQNNEAETTCWGPSTGLVSHHGTRPSPASPFWAASGGGAWCTAPCPAPPAAASPPACPP